MATEVEAKELLQSEKKELDEKIDGLAEDKANLEIELEKVTKDAKD